MRRSRRSLRGWLKVSMLRRVRSLMAAPTKPGHFLITILFYALTWIVVSYVFSLLSHRFGWSLWVNNQFSLGHSVVTGIVWGVAMVAVNFWRSQKRELS
jgi:hypothetical protein